MHNYATNGEPQTESPEFMGTKNLYQTSLRFYSNKLLCSLFGQRALLCLLSISFSKPVLGIRVYGGQLGPRRYGSLSSPFGTSEAFETSILSIHFTVWPTTIQPIELHSAAPYQMAQCVLTVAEQDCSPSARQEFCPSQSRPSSLTYLLEAN